MKNSISTSDIRPGSVLSYRDAANPYREVVVFEIEETRWGMNTKYINKEDNTEGSISGKYFQSGWQIVKF